MPHLDVVQVPFPADAGIEWFLDGKTATANKDSNACEASITIVKKLDPDTDPGKFDLEINGQVRGDGAAVGNGGTTGQVAVVAGRTYQVGESGAQGTKLDDYTISIVCRNGSDVVAEGTSNLCPSESRTARRSSARSPTQMRNRSRSPNRNRSRETGRSSRSSSASSRTSRETDGRRIARFSLGARKGIVAVTLVGTRLTLPNPRR